MKYTLIKGHTSSNYDGYDPHHHIMILSISPALYKSQISDIGLLYPKKIWAEIIVNPWLHPWVRQKLNLVGYDFNEKVESEHNDLYALGNYHDGIDTSPFAGGIGTKIAEVKTNYINIMKNYSHGEIYEIDSLDLLKDNECWLMHPITKEWMKGNLRNGTSYCDLPYRGIASGDGRNVVWDQDKKSAFWTTGVVNGVRQIIGKFS